MKHVYANELNAKQRASLKGMAHSLKPIIQVGAAGLSPTVITELKLALESHELIKIQLPGQTQAAAKEEQLAELLEKLPNHAHIVSRIGRNTIIYLEKDPKDAKITLKDLSSRTR